MDLKTKLLAKAAKQPQKADSPAPNTPVEAPLGADSVVREVPEVAIAAPVRGSNKPVLAVAEVVSGSNKPVLPVAAVVSGSNTPVPVPVEGSVVAEAGSDAPVPVPVEGPDNAQNPPPGEVAGAHKTEHGTTEAHTEALVGEVVPPAPRLSRPRKQLDYEPRRDRKGHWKEGQSGNPDGRPIGLVAYIRQVTGDGQELVDHAVDCVRGWVTVKWEDEHTGEMKERRMPADPRYQAEARAWLAERGYGKAPQLIQVESTKEEPLDYGALSTDEARTLLQLMAKASAAKALTSGAIAHSTALESRGSSEEEGQDT